MSKDRSNDQDWRSALWKGALTPSLITAIVAIIAGYLLRDLPGLRGSALATVTVLIFFSVHLFVARISRNLDPTSTMLIAMLSYFLKVVLMALFLVVVTRLMDPTEIDRPSFAVSALALTAAWLAGEIRAVLKIRFVRDV